MGKLRGAERGTEDVEITATYFQRELQPCAEYSAGLQHLRVGAQHGNTAYRLEASQSWVAFTVQSVALPNVGKRFLRKIGWGGGILRRITKLGSG